MFLARKDGLIMARVKVTRESESGRNLEFVDTSTGSHMTRTQFVREIKRGNYDDYYVRNINGIPTPCGKPDDNKKNNLG